MHLENLRCYLSYPIEYTEDKESLDKIIFSITNFLSVWAKVKVIDPRKIRHNDVSEIEDRKKLFEEKDYEEIHRQMKIIVRKDLRCVDISDFLIVILPKGIRTTGAIHESTVADWEKKPVLLFCPQGIEHIPLWLFGVFHPKYMFSEIDHLFEYLKEIDSGKKEDARWQFILRDSLDFVSGK